MKTRNSPSTAVRLLRLAEVHCLRKLRHVVGKFKGEHHETPKL